MQELQKVQELNAEVAKSQFPRRLYKYKPKSKIFKLVKANGQASWKI